MDRLSMFLTLMTGAVLTGALVIAAFSAGYYTWVAIAICVVFGFSLAWPAGYAISRMIKRNDPNFDHRNTPKSRIPDPNAPEV